MSATLPHFTLPLAPEAFLRDYWQKKPLFMPAAATGLDSPDADTLAGLALEDGVEARIIQGAGKGPWQLQQGPLDEDDVFHAPARQERKAVQQQRGFGEEMIN